MKAVGKKIWVIAEGYIPEKGQATTPELASHETACMLNASDEDAHVELFVYFADREPAGPYHITVPARRTKHVKFNDLKDPEEIPIKTEYASLITSNIPIVVQHTRLDSRQAANAIMSTIAYAGE
jgi:hypothetical protein